MEVRHQEFSPLERLLSLFTRMRAGEGWSVVLLCADVFLLMFAYYLLKVLRDPLILAEGSPELKSYATAAQAGLLLLLVPVFTWLYHHNGHTRERSRMLQWVTGFFSINLVIFAVCGYGSVSVGLAFYIWLGIFNVMVVALFWAFAADSYNVKSGQRLFAVIAVGGALGAWAGAKAAGALNASLGPYGLMILAAVLLLLVAPIAKFGQSLIPAASAARQRDRKPPPDNAWRRGFSLVLQDRYLLLIAVFIVLINWVNSTGEYILASYVVEAAEQGARTGEFASEQDFMTRFYADYVAWFTLAGLLLQLFLVSRLFRWFGVGGAMLILPLVMVASYGLIFLIPALAIVRLGMIAENSINYSVQNTGRHALFLPLDREAKYVGKNTIDTFFYRFGDLIYGASVFVGVTWMAMGVQQFVLFNILLATGALAVAAAIRKSNKVRVRDNLSNEPPVVAAPIPDCVAPAGGLTRFRLSPDTFMDPDVGDALSYHVQSCDGAPLPNWIRFDGLRRSFILKPPPEQQGVMELEVIARDFDGLQAKTRFRIIVENAESL